MHSKWFQTVQNSLFDIYFKKMAGNACNSGLLPYFVVASNNWSMFLSLLAIVFSKRLTAQSALRHPWLLNSALSTELHMTKVKLKRYVIRKRWIKAVNTIIALKRMGAKLDVCDAVQIDRSEFCNQPSLTAIELKT